MHTRANGRKFGVSVRVLCLKIPLCSVRQILKEDIGGQELGPLCAWKRQGIPKCFIR